MKNEENIEKAISKCKKIGIPYFVNYDNLNLIITDEDKEGKGVARGQFLVARLIDSDPLKLYLLKVLDEESLPNNNEIISSYMRMKQDDNPDIYSRRDYEQTGYKTKILGCLYIDEDDNIHFGTDMDYSLAAYKYEVLEPNKDILGIFCNLSFYEAGNRDDFLGEISYDPGFRLGRLRYSSTESEVAEDIVNTEILLNPIDIISNRTAMFGMTRTGKSNTVKKIIENTHNISRKINKPIGQLVFDVNGEYANSNYQGLSLKEKLLDPLLEDALDNERKAIQDTITVYGSGKDQKEFGIDFYKDLSNGFDFLKKMLEKEKSRDYFNEFLSIDFEEIGKYEEDTGYSQKYKVMKASLYRAILHRAKYQTKEEYTQFWAEPKVIEVLGLTNEFNKVKRFVKNSSLDKDIVEVPFRFVDEFWELISQYGRQEPKKDEENELYYTIKNARIINDEINNMPTIFSRRTAEGSMRSGYSLLLECKDFNKDRKDYIGEEILNKLRRGNIVILDLSSGDEFINKVISRHLTEYIYKECVKSFKKSDNKDGLSRIQLYFEEAHNLFDDTADITNIYNRVAKEAAKLKIGMIYSTQEPSSMPKHLLNQTENFFISSLNSKDELNFLSKFYDFEDLKSGNNLYNKRNDIGMAKVFTVSSPYTISVQVDNFEES